MPGMDGLGLLQEVERRRAELPVIMVTAYGDDEHQRRACGYGAAAFVIKPVDFDNLKRQLSSSPHCRSRLPDVCTWPFPEEVWATAEVRSWG